MENPNFNIIDFVYYPNPISDILNITNENLIDWVEAFNILGQLIICKMLESKEIKLRSDILPLGTYFAKMRSDRKSKTVKILKQSKKK